jgi:hypothetical protein
MHGLIFIRRQVVLVEWIHHQDRFNYICTIFFFFLSFFFFLVFILSSHKIFSLMIDSLFFRSLKQGAICRLILLGFSSSFTFVFVCHLFACIPSSLSYHHHHQSPPKQMKYSKKRRLCFALVTVSIYI